MCTPQKVDRYHLNWRAHERRDSWFSDDNNGQLMSRETPVCQTSY